MVYVGNIAKTMNVIGKEKYFRKRPTNALIAKAVEICAQKGIAYLNTVSTAFAGKRRAPYLTLKGATGFRNQRSALLCAANDEGQTGTGPGASSGFEDTYALDRYEVCAAPPLALLRESAAW